MIWKKTVGFSYFVSTVPTAYDLITKNIAVSPVVPNCIIESESFSISYIFYFSG